MPCKRFSTARVSEAVIPFILPGKDREFRVSFFAYDLNGKRVEIQKESIYSSGDHLLYWDAGKQGGYSINQGLYFIIMNVDGTKAGQQKIIIR